MITPMLRTIPTAGAGAPSKANDDSIFLTLEAKLAFLRLRQGFTEAFILYHFDPEYYIRIETNASDYSIGSIVSQLTPESGQ